MPVVWASRILGKPLNRRVFGRAPNPFEVLMEPIGREGLRVYLLGAREEVVLQVKEIFEGLYPALQIAGHRNGYWKAHEESEVVEQIVLARADILFVAISSPRTVPRRLRGNHARAVCHGCGGSFDVASGRLKRAPRWMRNRALNGSFASCRNPGACSVAHSIDDMAFFGMLAREWWRR